MNLILLGKNTKNYNFESYQPFEILDSRKVIFHNVTFKTTLKLSKFLLLFSALEKNLSGFIHIQTILQLLHQMAVLQSISHSLSLLLKWFHMATQNTESNVQGGNRFYWIEYWHHPIVDVNMKKCNKVLPNTKRTKRWFANPIHNSKST